MSFHTDIEAIEVKDPQEREEIRLDHLQGDADDAMRAEEEFEEEDENDSYI